MVAALRFLIFALHPGWLAGARGKKEKQKIEWKAAPSDALQRAAGELFAAGISIGSRWVAACSSYVVLIVTSAGLVNHQMAC